MKLPIGRSKIIDFAFRKVVSYTIVKRLRAKRRGGGYYIIVHPHTAGFFSDWFYMLGHMIIADKHKLVPFVDMQNYPSLYQDTPPFDGILNGWNQFFEQCTTIEMAYNNEHYIAEEKYPFGFVPYYSTTCLLKEGYPTKRKVRKVHGYMVKYIPIRQGLQQEFDDLAVRWKISDCVGVHIRGTDMRNTKGHNKPEALSDNFERIEKLRKKHGFKRVFLCTDEESIRVKMQERFNGTLEIIWSEAYRSLGSEVGVHLEKNAETKRLFHKYYLGVEVLRDTYLLSKCSALICGKSNVAYAAIIMNNNRYHWINCKAK